jgi:carboxylate-amine ligase
MEPSPQKTEQDLFGASTPLSIGVEEELLLVDDLLCLSASSEQVLGEIDPAFRKRVSTEIFATQIELKTGICDGASEAVADLTRVRRAVRETGAEMLGSGLHPDDHEEQPALAEKPRYEVVQKDFASLLKTPPCGLHVHVGMPDAETAVQVGNALRYHLPLLQAITANSPFRQGTDSGLASARTAVVRSYPRFEMPRAFRDYEDFRHIADQLIAAAGVDDYTYLWWDVRPHPRLGTVEVRAMDVQPTAEANVAVAAFVQALAAKEIDQAATPELCREALEESYYQASRYGLEARLMVDDEVAEPVADVAKRVLAEVRPYASQLGGEDALDEIERIVRDGNGADDQRRIHQAAGMDGLLAWLAERSGPTGA